MSLDIFLLVDGVEGEARDRAHANEIEVLSFGWGASNPGSDSTGGGGGAGRPQFQALSVMKRVDKASPKLFLSCITGKHIKQCVLTARRKSGSIDFLSVKLTGCVIASITESGSHDAGLAQETVAMNFGRIVFDYRPQKADGTADSPVVAGWDLEMGRPV
jgi:type VI secretion system secreted protein Hcp